MPEHRTDKRNIIISRAICHLAAVTLIFCGACNQATPPKAKISNGIITAHLYLPDANAGYYQSTRFDWSGVIYRLEHEEHNYCGPWFENYDPKKHDAICGPVDEFGEIGYNDAKAGESFLKIGVGMLKKSSDKEYNRFEYHEISNPGTRALDIKKDSAIFKHTLNDNKGYSYEYSKTIKLVKNKPEMVISHQLKNTGSRKITTTVYNHNFFIMNNQNVGPGVTVQFPFELDGKGTGIDDIAKIEKNRIVFHKAMAGKDRVYIEDLRGFGKDIKDNSFAIENKQTGTGIKMTANQPIHRMVFWSCRTTSCPEPYILIEIEPGKDFSWENRYELYSL